MATQQNSYLVQLEILEGLDEPEKFLDEKIKEISDDIEPLESGIVAYFNKVNVLHSPLDKFFWKEALKATLPQDYETKLETLQHLRRLKKSLALRKSPHERIDFSQLKNEAKQKPIEELYSFEKVKRFRNKIVALCPFHDEKTASFNIFINDNRFHCFGCGAKGDAVDFFQKLHGVDFKVAVKEMAVA